MNILKKLQILLLALFFSGCSANMIDLTGGGLLFGHRRFPTRHPKQSVSAEVGSKSGEACIYGVLSLVSFGDASVRAAAVAGGITNVFTVDAKSFTLLPFGVLFSQYCTVVSGN